MLRWMTAFMRHYVLSLLTPEVREKMKMKIPLAFSFLREIRGDTQAVTGTFHFEVYTVYLNILFSFIMYYTFGLYLKLWVSSH